ncbi:hypothetical protein C7271_15610 [filamentous cyanobacterium CCP5]|nr:hypothetical protein C7293_31660 [filamentous cyanobacterium CCT1]PSN17839.1 hypothetical protein C7271_15610 [filamentous cyanobacterium CCP5]
MFHQSESESTHQPANQPIRSISLPPADQSVLRIFMLGDVETLRRMIGRLATNGIADANSWSQPQETGRTGEFITVHTKRMRADTV